MTLTCLVIGNGAVDVDGLMDAGADIEGNLSIQSKTTVECRHRTWSHAY